MPKRAVWKYQPKCHNRHSCLFLPHGAIIRSAISIDDELCVYVEVDPAEQMTCADQIIALGTGYTADLDGFIFLNTVHHVGCNEVYHVYYRPMPI